MPNSWKLLFGFFACWTRRNMRAFSRRLSNRKSCIGCLQVLQAPRFAYAGEFGNLFQQKPKILPVPPADSLEAQLHTLGRQHLFVEFDRLSPSHPIRKPMLAWPLGYHTMRSAWADNFDAIIFSDVMFPNTKDAKLPDGGRTHRKEQTR